MHYGIELRLPVRARRQAVSRRLRRDGAGVRRRTASLIERADELGPALREALASKRPDGDSGADGERADADAGSLGHQRHLPAGRVTRSSRSAALAYAVGCDSTRAVRYACGRALQEANVINLKAVSAVASALLCSVCSLQRRRGRRRSRVRRSPGIVRDSSGGALPGAEVTITKTDTGAVRTVFTAEDGGYVHSQSAGRPVSAQGRAAGIQHLRAGRHRPAGEHQPADQRHARASAPSASRSPSPRTRRWSKRTRPASARSSTTSASSSCR